MADNVISSFLVALGFDVNQGSLNTAKKSIADYEKAVKDAEKRIEDARWEGAKTEEEIAKLTRETNLKEARAALANAQDKEKSEKDLAKKRQERARDFVAGFNKMAIAAAAAATAISYAVAKVAGSFDNLYFQAQRSGTSVQSLKALGYAFSQTGGTAQQASAAVDSFTTALRNNPGLRQFVKDLGVDDNLQGVDKLLATLDALKKEPYEVAVQHAGMLGISEDTFNQYARQGDALKAYRKEYDETAKRLGLNSKEAADAATAFQRATTRLQSTVSVLGEKLIIQLAPALEKIAKGFTDWLAANPEKVEHVLKSISDAIIWLTQKITALVEWFAGSDGAAFLKRWDDFSNRVASLAHGFEVVWGVLQKIDAWLESSTIWRFIKDWAGLIGSGRFGLGGVIQDYLTGRGGGGGGGALGVGAIGGFNPLEGGGGAGEDRRNLWQRHAPKWLGGKDAPAGGAPPLGSSAGNLTALIEAEAKRAGIDPRIMQGIRAGESGHRANYDKKDDAIESSWGPFQLNRRGGLGAQFEKDTGLDVRDPRTIPAQARWVAEYIKKGGNLSAWRGYRGPRDADPSWGDSGYAPTPSEPQAQTKPPEGVTDISRQANYRNGQMDGVKGFVMHHTGGRGTPEGVVKTLNERGLGVQYVMDRDGRVYQTLPNGARGAHIRPAENGSGLNNSNTLGMEVIAKDDRDITPAQVAAAKAFLEQQQKLYPGLQVYGHGEINGHKQETEGMTIVKAFRAGQAAQAWRRGSAQEAQSGNASPTKPNMTPGGFDVNKIDPRDLMRAPPLGANSVNHATSNDNRAVHQTINTHTTINEARNTKEAGRAMEGTFGRMHSMALANAQSAVA